ncbi:DNA polymerase III subunit gamma and tau, partial [Streptomyces spiramenti]|uniref:DNA polymerase III subunit gamma and tau n=1 Tax=Streptomyces spiramenti TaxID=2720606 RepID=UPI00308427BA
MSSLALYRRYRPETFAEVIGQEHVTDPLRQALLNNRVNHAYLFSGPRGCGKTTSARILARCLNCVQGPTPDPCGECHSCQDLARGGPGSIDVIEIDAASHGGVEDARELREKAFFGPAASRYKIYIIDEAHMVTSAGFNALLKVVEEPPEHLKFIFATTEPEKVIGTIRSRTHHYPFRLVPPGTLRDYLAEVCEREAIPVDSAVLPLVVRAGAGSVRDSMSVMDQLLAGAADDGVTYPMATALLGYTDSALLDSVVDAFAAGDGGAAFEVVDRVIEGGHDPRRFVADLLERLRDLVILAAVPEAADKGLFDVPADTLATMTTQANRFGPAGLSRAADLVNTGLTEMRGATSPRLQLELICARVLLPAAYADERSLQTRLERLERGGFAQAAAAPPAPVPVAQPPAAASAPLPPAAQPVPAPPVEHPQYDQQPPAQQHAAPAAQPHQAPPQPPHQQPAEAPQPAANAQRPGAWPTGGGSGGGGAARPATGAAPGAWPG